MPNPTTNEHPQNKTTPSVGTGQGTDARAAHPKRNMPNGTPNTPTRPGRRNVSWTSKVPSRWKRRWTKTRYHVQYQIAPIMHARRTQTNTAPASPLLNPYSLGYAIGITSKKE